MMHILRVLKGSDTVLRVSFDHHADLTGFKAWMQIRKSKSNEVVLDELTTENKRISIGPGCFCLSFPHEITEDWSFRRGVFDIKAISPDGGEVRMAEGKILVIPGVTR